ncbi:NAD(P)-dependent oxidoreductase [Natronolimnobius sp. AArcel1]|uniref:NAD-dependent epimerase/dehydratase family protein n=1 Tax=Natronolimnobius sp. AArcel1 TaxID=1679093 RepID=UPI0013EC6FB0|nr:NAD(P)-dependent oxidoreductase [Natronolimnobius sp. AArcel1]NGM71281.1 NAD(P)-dependent oxidoreductase [Natronolimnobius sp. AArcel1]
MSIEVVAVTGGNGRIGERVLVELNEHGYRTVNLERSERRKAVADQYVTIDLEDAGQVYGALAQSGADAVIHMGTVSSPRHQPGYVTYRNNVMSTYHVLEAAVELGLEAVCLASSINAMGASFQDVPIEVEYLPVDEEHPTTPRDPYAIAKRVIEVTADGFGRDENEPPIIGSLRYPWVANGEELDSSFVRSDRTLEAGVPDVPGGVQELFAYVHVDDAAAAARRVIEADFDGHETFWIVADGTTMETSTDELVKECYPDAALRRSFSGHESLVENTKAKDRLGWEPDHSWRMG